MKQKYCDIYVIGEQMQAALLSFLHLYKKDS